MPKLIIRQTRPEDIDALVRLQREVYPHIAAWHRDRVVQQIEMFPQGQLVAYYDSRLVGCASALVIRWDEWADEHTWDEITAAGTFDTHDPAGFTLYGAEVFITPSDFPFARDGIAAEGVPNMEQIVIADVDLGKLVMNRVSGTTIPLYDKRVDVYNNDVEVVATA